MVLLKRDKIYDSHRGQEKAQCIRIKKGARGLGYPLECKEPYSPNVLTQTTYKVSLMIILLLKRTCLKSDGSR